jgi:hypothetical protein
MRRLCRRRGCRGGGRCCSSRAREARQVEEEVAAGIDGDAETGGRPGVERALPEAIVDDRLAARSDGALIGTVLKGSTEYRLDTGGNV